MLSLMTVVLPQHSGNTRSSKTASDRLLAGSSSSREAFNADNTSGVGLNDRNENCGCPCRSDNMTKTSAAPRCPYLKGYMVEQTRHMHTDMNRMQLHLQQSQQSHHQQQPHPVTVGEMESLREAACYWKEKYERLYESQKRLQKVNEGLEEKLLKIAEKFEGEKSDLTKDVSDLTARLVEARLTIVELEEENEQYRNDCSIAVRLLQCKPSNFVAHKFNSLPADFQTKVKRHLNTQSNSRRSSSSAAGSSRNNSSTSSSSSPSLLDQCHPDVRTITVSVPTLPPAAMLYSVDHNNHTRSGQLTNCNGAFSSGSTTVSSSSSSEESTPDHVSAAIIAKVLEERGKERQLTALANKQSRIDFYQKGQVLIHTSTQTTQPNFCSRCNVRIAVTDRDCSRVQSGQSPIAEPSRLLAIRQQIHQQPTITISTETAI